MQRETWGKMYVEDDSFPQKARVSLLLGENREYPRIYNETGFNTGIERDCDTITGSSRRRVGGEGTIGFSMASESSTSAARAAATPDPIAPGASQKSGSSDSKRSGRAGKIPLEEMLTSLNLWEDEEEDIVLEEDPEELGAKARWLALAKVFTTRTFSHGALYRDMRAAWNLAKEVEFRAIEDNLFSMQFQCLADWERVMHGGPWIFRGSPVLMAEYDGWADLETIELNLFPAWVHVLDLKEKMRTAIIAKQLSKRAGTYVSIDVMSVKGAGEGVRVRVMIDVCKPISRVASITLMQKKMCFRLQYEKMPDYCGVCGFVGHRLKECGDGVWPEEKIIYPASLIVPAFRRDPAWLQGNGGHGGRGGGSGRGRGRGGRGDGFKAGHRPKQFEEDEDLRSTASSPSKPPDIRARTGNTKRRLELEDDGRVKPIEQLLLTYQPTGAGDATMQTAEDAKEEHGKVGDNEGNSTSSRDSKRAKVVEDSNQTNDLAKSAGSEEPRRA
jgi:hypothetical protein